MKSVTKCNILIFFMFITHLSFGQIFNSGTTPTDFYTEIDYQWSANKIIIPVEIEGEIYRFLLDTGAPNVISSELNEILNTEFQQSVSIADANNKIDSLDLVTVPLMKIGGVSYSDIPSLVINKNDSNLMFDCLNVDGFVGSNLLRNSIIQISPEEMIIRLTDDRDKLSLKKRYSSKIEFIDNQSTPYIWIKLNAHKKANEQVYVDTGMKGFYNLANDHLAIFQKDEILEIRSEAYGSKGSGIFGTENQSTYYNLIIPKIEINKASFREVSVETTNDFNSRIGAEILRYGIVTIDYKNKLFYYEPFVKVIDLQETSFGFNPTIKDGKFVIGLVWDDALKGRISGGDQIIEINGIDFMNYDLCDLLHKPSVFEVEELLEMTVLDSNGKKKTLTVYKNYR